jgi:hypothetical protein
VTKHSFSSGGSNNQAQGTAEPAGRMDGPKVIWSGREICLTAAKFDCDIDNHNNLQINTKKEKAK